jgi:hypothetical protein
MYDVNAQSFILIPVMLDAYCRGCSLNGDLSKTFKNNIFRIIEGHVDDKDLDSETFFFVHLHWVLCSCPLNIEWCKDRKLKYHGSLFVTKAYGMM